MLEQIAKNIRERNLIRDGERVLVAVSGGVDSMVLLHLLHQLKCKLIVAHFNHRLRGRDSDADERLVRTVATRLGLKVIVDSADVQAHAHGSKQSVEMAARQLRHEFFARTAKRLKIKTVVLAHHADDQVELFFLRLLRGASPEGLAGMKWRGRSVADKSLQIVRPLLNVSRDEIESFAREKKIKWREDKTNASIDFLRNRIRRELIPLLEKNYQPAVRKKVLQLMEVLHGESEFVTEEARAHRDFNKMPVAVQRRFLRQQLFDLNVPAEFETIETLRLNVGKIVEVNPTMRLKRDESGRIAVARRSAADFSDAQKNVTIARSTRVSFAGCEFNFEVVKKTGAMFRPVKHTEFFDADKVGRQIVLRHWKAGDRFQPIGAKSARKLQDMFVDLKVPKEERHKRVIAAAADGEIFWVEGLRIGERFKLTSVTKGRLIFSWKRE